MNFDMKSIYRNRLNGWLKMKSENKSGVYIIKMFPKPSCDQFLLYFKLNRQLWVTFA